MFGFHFSVKSDKKPNRENVAAARHEKYILREGEYKSDAFRKNKELSYKDCLTGKNPILNLPKQERLIYESPFGNIKQDENGIYISEGASIETVAIALSVAEKVYGKEISVKGSNLFREKNIRAASELNLPIQFIHRTLEKRRRIEKEKIENDRNEFEYRGGRYSNPRIRIGGTRNENFQKFGIKLRSLRDIATGRLRLPRLSEWRMDSNSKRRGVLLSRDQISDIRNKQRELSDKVRWDTAPARRRIVKETAANIMVNISEHEENALNHIQYITRDSIYSHKGGCIFVSKHLPKWAKDNSKYFWEMADLYERKNGERYKEIVFSLPNVLNLEAQKEIIEIFIGKHLQNHYYTYAIHNKIGSLSEEEEHPHVHIMFSTREIDEYERNIGRSPKQFFSRYNKSNPGRGGCKKSDKWRDKDRFDYYYKLRYDIAKIENEVLEKNGIHLRVDPRSLKEQKQNAIMEGNELLAKLLDRIPEKYVKELASITDESNPIVIKQKENRKKIRAKTKNIEDQFISEVAEEKRKLSAIWKIIDEKRENLNKIYNELPQNLQMSFKNFILKMNESGSEVTALRAIVYDTDNSFQKAMLDFLDKDAIKNFTALKKYATEKRECEHFKNMLNVPKENEDEFLKIRNEIESNIRILDDKIRKYAKNCKPYFDTLAKDKKMRGLIRAQGINYINEDRKARSDLKKATYRAIHDINVAERGIKFYLKQNAKNPQTVDSIKTRTLEELVKIQMQIKEIQVDLKELEKKIITPNRAIFIAKDVFTKGGFKKLRQEKRNLEKKKHSMSKDMYEKNFFNILKREKSLEEKCNLPFSDKKIKEIAAGILKKNAPIQEEYKKKKEDLNTLLQTEEKWKKAYFELDKKTNDPNIYALGTIKDENFITPKLETQILATAIAKLSGHEKWASIVMQKKPDEIDEWRYLSETEKADLRANLNNIDRY